MIEQRFKKIEDKYSWENVNFPASFDDITTFENNNRICVNVFGFTESTKEINPVRLGHIPYVAHDNINLLLIQDEQENGHYVYIKKLESLLHTVNSSDYKDRSICKKVTGKDVIFEAT